MSSTSELAVCSPWLFPIGHHKGQEEMVMWSYLAFGEYMGKISFGSNANQVCLL
jgi:hypothetical protein